MKIVVATDFSDCSGAAEDRVLDLTHALGAEILYVHVAVEAPLYNEPPFAKTRARGWT